MGQDMVNTKIREAWTSNVVVLDYQEGELVCRLVDGHFSEVPPVVEGEVGRVRVEVHRRRDGIDLRSPWVTPETLAKVAGTLDRQHLAKMADMGDEVNYAGAQVMYVARMLLDNVPAHLFDEVMSGIRAWSRGVR